MDFTTNQFSHLKYSPLTYEIHLGPDKQLGIIVTSDWKHRFMIIKVVIPGSIAAQLGFQRHDRIFMIDGVCAPKLNMKRLKETLNNKKHFLITIMRKNQPKGKGMQSPSSPNALEENTYTIVSGQKHFEHLKDDDLNNNNNKSNFSLMDQPQSSWIYTPTCTSVNEFFDRQRVAAAAVNTKLHISTPIRPNKNKEEHRHHHWEDAELVIGDHIEFEGDLAERKALTQQQQQKSKRIMCWLATHPKEYKPLEPEYSGGHHQQAHVMTESFLENKENFKPVGGGGAYWTKEMPKIGGCNDKNCTNCKTGAVDSELLVYASKPDNIRSPEPVENPRRKPLANLMNIAPVSLANASP